MERKRIPNLWLIVVMCMVWWCVYLWIRVSMMVIVVCVLNVKVLGDTIQSQNKPKTLLLHNLIQV